jgi:hypothetical protein
METSLQHNQTTWRETTMTKVNSQLANQSIVNVNLPKSLPFALKSARRDDNTTMEFVIPAHDADEYLNGLLKAAQSYVEQGIMSEKRYGRTTIYGSDDVVATQGLRKIEVTDGNPVCALVIVPFPGFEEIQWSDKIWKGYVMFIGSGGFVEYTFYDKWLF